MRIGIGLAITGRRRRRVSPFDPDALAYIQAVEAADGEPLEAGVRVAYDQFVRGCKEDGIFDALKASCIMAGARTLSGALVPLVGPAPTNFNFVSGDYDRVTGLKGDGSTKYLDSNRNANEDPRDSYHQAAWISERRTSGPANVGIIGAGLTQTGTSHFFDRGSNYGARSRSSGSFNDLGSAANLGLTGHFRNQPSTARFLSGGVSTSFSQTSQTPINQTVLIFGRDLSAEYNGRLAFYSIGENLNEAELDNRTTALMNAINEALT